MTALETYGSGESLGGRFFVRLVQLINGKTDAQPENGTKHSPGRKLEPAAIRRFAHFSSEASFPTALNNSSNDKTYPASGDENGDTLGLLQHKLKLSS